MPSILIRRSLVRFAEIGAGQEVARWFLAVEAASGTVAKTISAYDKEVSDDLYGPGVRYVSRERLEAMLDGEWAQLLKQLQKTRGSQTRFFSFVDTVSARNYAGTNEPHGCVGLRFQLEPGGHPNDIVLHINLRDLPTSSSRRLLVFGVKPSASGLPSNTDEGVLPSRCSPGFGEAVDLPGVAFETWDCRALLVHLAQAGLAEAVCFPSAGSAIPPTEVLYKKAVVVAPGYFEHVDQVHAEIHERMLRSAIQQLQGELDKAQSARRLRLKNLCHGRGSPHRTGPTWVQVLPN